MSFDVYFVPRPPDGRWESAMEQRLAAATGDPQEPTADDLALWHTIVEAVTPLVPQVEVFERATYRQLDDGAGMQLTMAPGELSLTTPYWYEGDEAAQVVERLRQISAAIEQATGLVAYDPQADAAFLDEAVESAAATFDRVGEVIRTELAARRPPTEAGGADGSPADE